MAHYLSQSRIEDPIWLEPNDISFLQTRISEAETVAQRTENQIEELRAQISELTRHKDAKLAEITTCRNILAPVRRMPLEILSGIFELACLPEDTYYRNDLVRSMFALCGVCAAWRKVAQATPRLWCRLDISFQRHHLGSDFGWVEGWITGCQGLPLDLYLDFYVIQGSDLKAIILKERGSEFLEYVLANFGHKIRVLHVSGHPSLFLPIFHLPLSSPLISLEHVYLSPLVNLDDLEDWDQMVKGSSSKSEVFLGSPKLRELELYDPSFLNFLVLPVEQLTSLKLKPDWELAACWDLLSQCRNLVSLEISGWTSSLVDSSLIVSLPALKSFRIPVFCPATGYFLRGLTAPHLEKLHLGYDIEDLDALVDDITSFQQQSAARVSSLTLSHRGYLSEPLTKKMVTIFSLFPTIHLFNFLTPKAVDVDSLIQTMTWTEGYHVLPNLKQLKLYCSSPEEYFDTFKLKSMVLSRWWPERLGVGSNLMSEHNGLCRLQEVTVRNLHVRGSIKDITDLSELSGFIFHFILPKCVSQV